VNADNFDRLTRRLSRRTTRRRTLQATAFSAAFVFNRKERSVRAQSGSIDGITLGGPCIDSAGCVQVQGCDVPGPVICADNGIADDGQLNCCMNEGGYCGDDAHCCVGLACVGRGGDGCGAGRCQFTTSAGSNPECEAYVASVLAQLLSPVAYATLANWGQSTPDFLGLPEHCPWPMLPPESPWCTPDYCVDYIPLVHSADGLEYCYWYDPTNEPVYIGGPAEWHCGSLALIASME
jgi:hypothetical protein